MPSGCCWCSCWPAACDSCACSTCCSFPLPEIEEREDEDPDQFHEVPVQAHDLDDLVIALAAGEKARTLPVEVAAQHLDRHDDEENHADGHVRAVKARDH